MIDAFSPKNQYLDSDKVAAILERAGVVPNSSLASAAFVRQDGDRAMVRARAELIEETAIPPDAKIVTQISRWDPLKDHLA